MNRVSVPTIVENNGTLTVVLELPRATGTVLDRERIDYIMVNGQIIQLDSNSHEGSASLGGGMEAAVDFEFRRSYEFPILYYYPRYTITITNVQQDLEIGYFAKDVLGSDYESTIAVLGLNGVTLYVWNEDTQQLEEANVGDVLF